MNKLFRKGINWELIPVDISKKEHFLPWNWFNSKIVNTWNKIINNKIVIWNNNVKVYRKNTNWSLIPIDMTFKNHFIPKRKDNI